MKPWLFSDALQVRQLNHFSKPKSDANDDSGLHIGDRKFVIVEIRGALVNGCRLGGGEIDSRERPCRRQRPPNLKLPCPSSSLIIPPNSSGAARKAMPCHLENGASSFLTPRRKSRAVDWELISQDVALL